ncbi:hypothetical protein [Novipirellula sp.]|uniref:hypothetical protein n=1 Tax=Novipirellula sp. TaxID=2795430 RepID=UPI0035667974
MNQTQVKINGVDVFNAQAGDGRSTGIACWFIDTNYNEERIFVRHAYYLGPRSQDNFKAEAGRPSTATSAAPRTNRKPAESQSK